MWTYTEVWWIPGPQTGRGPRGYQRSDERIREDVNDRLLQHGQIDASDIDVKVQIGEVTLTGTVNNRQEKRMAEDTAESVWGVKEVHNQLRVKQQGQQNGQNQSKQGNQTRKS
jgi:osmotically-inducible protein OsmY